MGAVRLIGPPTVRKRDGLWKVFNEWGEWVGSSSYWENAIALALGESPSRLPRRV